MSDLYALLIGIDDYDDRDVNGIAYPKLSGCVRDINHVHAFLQDRLGVVDERIIKLTAPRQGGGAAEGDWPVYANLVAAFRQLLALAQEPGDQVYIHYSGHGGRAATVFPDLKGANGFDEALVPVDIGDPAAQYLRDVEIHGLLKAMGEKGLEVTVVFDSCHSGGATRGKGLGVARGIGKADNAPRPHVSAVADLMDIQEQWRQDAAVMRGVKPASGWLLNSGVYTFLAACRANESAYEYPFNGVESNGALTYYLLDTLRQSGHNISYRAVMDRIIGCVHGIFALQTPMLQGEGDRRVFGSERMVDVHAVRVLELTDEGKVRLQAGAVHGIAPGAQFKIFRYDADLRDEQARTPVVEVQTVDSSECLAEIVEMPGRTGVMAGDLAVLIGVANVKLQSPVRMVVDDPALHTALEQAIIQTGKGFVIVAQAAEAPHFQVLLNKERDGLEICDPAGVALPNVPAAPLSAQDTVAKTVQRLVHLAKYRNVESLRAPGGEAAAKLSVELVDPPIAADGRIVYHPDDAVTVCITNNQLPGAVNDPTRILNVTALDLAADWSVTQIHPADAADFESVDPGQSITIEFDAWLPDGVVANTDRIKVLATAISTDFRWLELPVLGKPIGQKGVRKRSAGDPLAALFDQVVGDQVTTRSLRVKSKPTQTWTVGDVELCVERT